MTRHDDVFPLEHMIEAANEVLLWSATRTRESLYADAMFQAAVLHHIQVIGEAARRLSQSFRDTHPSVVWPQIIALRNILMHRYDRVDLDKVWQVITEDLQPLVDYLEPLLPPEDE